MRNNVLNQENLRKKVFKFIKMLGSCIIKKDTFKSKTNFYVLCIKHFCEFKKRGIKQELLQTDWQKNRETDKERQTEKEEKINYHPRKKIYFCS